MGVIQYFLSLFCIALATSVYANQKNVTGGDAITLLVLLLGLITSSEVAHALAPYMLIAIAGFAGAVVKASSMDREWRPSTALGFIMARVMLALVLTVSVAEILQLIIPEIKPRYSLSLIAFAISGYFEEIKEKVPDIIKALIPERWKNGNGK